LLRRISLAVVAGKTAGRYYRVDAKLPGAALLGIYKYQFENARSEEPLAVCALSIIDTVLDYAIVGGLVWLGLTPYLGLFVAAGFFTFWNYFWYRYWVFAG
jgi:hypothetical protein